MKRYWKIKWSMGYVGTEKEEEIDLLDYYTAEETEEISEDKIIDFLCELAWEEACSKIESSCEAMEEKGDIE